MSNLTCPVCDGVIPPKTSGYKAGRPKAYCSDSCKLKANRAAAKLAKPYARRCAVSFPTCEFCDRIFSARSRKPVRACKDADCQRLLRNQQQAGWFEAYRAANGVSYGHAMYAGKRLVYKLERRALLAEGFEVFPPAEVFERDGWICQLCGVAVDPAIAWPDRLSTSLDHIVPLSKGGEHTRDNTQLSHLGCNSSKQDSTDWTVLDYGRSRNKAEARGSAAQPEQAPS